MAPGSRLGNRRAICPACVLVVRRRRGAVRGAVSKHLKGALVARKNLEITRPLGSDSTGYSDYVGTRGASKVGDQLTAFPERHCDRPPRDANSLRS
jgi:hypothetical protein